MFLYVSFLIKFVEKKLFYVYILYSDKYNDKILISIIKLLLVSRLRLILNLNLIVLYMTASFLPPILTPVVTLVFPGLVFALFFVLVEQEEVA